MSKRPKPASNERPSDMSEEDWQTFVAPYNSLRVPKLTPFEIPESKSEISLRTVWPPPYRPK